MFESLTEKFNSVFKSLSGRGRITEANISDAMREVRKALLEKALTFFVSFLEERGDDPEVRAEAAKAQKRAGDILKLLGEHERAEKHYANPSAY